MTLRLLGIDALTVTQRQKWAAARVWTTRQAPYLASAILALEPVVVVQDSPSSVGTSSHDLRAFPTDTAWHVYLDPEVVAAVEVPEIGFWLLHQVTHLLRHHADRYPVDEPPTTPLAGRSTEQRLWNLAGDAEINDDLTVDALHLPERAVTPMGLGLPDSWIAEEYWDKLTNTTPPARGPLFANTPPPPAAPRPDAPLPPAASLPPGTSLPADHPDSGTGADGQPRPWNCGREGLSEVGEKLLQRDVARRIRTHSQTRGELPAGWRRWSDEVLEPVVNWRSVLRSAVRRGVADVAGRVDFTYRRPSRRAAALPEVILPSLRQPLPTVAVVIDTSGSMSDTMLAQILGEIGGLLTSVGVARDRLHVVCCDAKAYAAQRVLNAREVQLLGGGGTDMGVGLAATTELVPRPDLVIVLTDGHTPWPARPPGRARVLVGLMDPKGSVPGWATSVTIDPEQVRNGR